MATESAPNDKLAFMEATAYDPKAHGLRLISAFRLANIGLMTRLANNGSADTVTTNRLMDLSDRLGRQIATRVSQDPDSWELETREASDISAERFLEIETNVADQVGFFVTNLEVTYLQQTGRFDDQLHVMPRIQPSHTTPSDFLIPFPFSDEARAEL